MQLSFADVSPWHFTMREMQPARVLRFLAVQAAIALAAGLLLGKIGGFGTYRELAAPERYAYWLSLTALDWGLIVALAASLRRLPALARLPVTAQAAIAALGAALPTTAMVYWLESLLRFMQEFSGLHLLYFNVAVISLALALLVALIFTAAARRPMNAAAPPMAIPREPAFLRRLPPQLGRELLALEMEDHYLRIHTARGSALILYRLRDALQELHAAGAPYAGQQVHRSWWVARNAVAAARREGGRPVLQLTNGLQVPVSRSFREALRQAGWL